MRSELINCFQNTLKISEGKLGKNTMLSIKSNRVYKENFVSKIPHKNEKAVISIYEGTTFDIAKKYCQFGRVAVLNFANPEIPGGGVCNGAMAQEECLCRSSNLYPCINNENVFEEYFNYHRKMRNHFYSDRLIYTKDVIVFKNDDKVPVLMSESEWFPVDVITCAAPYLGKRKYTNLTALLSLFKGRIKNIFEAARDNKVDIIVLGAFGCGAFKNPPLIVAEAFKQVIKEENYFSEFKHIVFAIKTTDDKSPNYTTFWQQFDEYIVKPDGRNSILPKSLESRFARISSLFEQRVGIDEERFLLWQKKNKYYGKQFSILGDSISTLDGYNPRGYKVFYSGKNCGKSGVLNVQDTWWDKVISYFGGELLVNNSWSGSRVTKLPDREELFPSGCSDERTSALHIGDIKPDVIIVYLGTNDWAYGVETGMYTHLLGEDFTTYCDEFYSAYKTMLKKLKLNYPNSEIWCCTLCETYISERKDFVFPYEYTGTDIYEYSSIIKDVASNNLCKLIDLHSYKEAYDSIDGSHPTSDGMNTIANMIIRSMIDLNEESFLECKSGGHNYAIAEEHTGVTKYICTSCGKILWHSNLLPIEEKMILSESSENKEKVREDEYVMLDPNITQILYENILKLTMGSNGKEVQFKKNFVTVGRGSEVDLAFNDNKMIARKHAIFYYENSSWFIMDNHSTNGTWLNGVRIESGKKYQLQGNDEVHFAMTERVVFYKSRNIEPSKVNIENGHNMQENKEYIQDKFENKKDKYIGRIIAEQYYVSSLLLGKGGFYNIYLVEDRLMKKVWAMIVCDKTNRNYNFFIKETILKEWNIMKTLSHSTIPVVVNICEDEESIFIIREYIEGMTLEYILKNFGAQPFDKVIAWAKELCSMLLYLHSLTPPYIYRDMKPANVVLMDNHHLKVIDFSAIRKYDSEKNKDTCALVTRGYAAPEQFSGRGQTDVRTDIYGLGMTMHHLVTGMDPKQHPYEMYPICQINPSLPKGLEYIITKCTEIDPERRYQNCHELMYDLEHYENLPKTKNIFRKWFRH